MITFEEADALRIHALNDIGDIVGDADRTPDARLREVKEVLRCADLIGGLYYGKDPAGLLELAKTRAPRLHEGLKNLLLSGKTVLRDKISKAEDFYEQVQREQAKVKQDAIRIEAARMSLDHERALFDKEQEYLKLENQRLLAEVRTLKLASVNPSTPAADDAEDDFRGRLDELRE